MKIGKKISGTGMDANIIGRFNIPATSSEPTTAKLSILDVI